MKGFIKRFAIIPAFIVLMMSILWFMFICWWLDAIIWIISDRRWITKNLVNKYATKVLDWTFYMIYPSKKLGGYIYNTKTKILTPN